MAGREGRAADAVVKLADPRPRHVPATQPTDEGKTVLVQLDAATAEEDLPHDHHGGHQSANAGEFESAPTPKKQ